MDEQQRARILKATDKLIADIWRHGMAEHLVTIIAREDAPRNWDISRIELTVTAKDEDAAEEIADNLITLIQADAKVVRAMEIDSTTELL